MKVRIDEKKLRQKMQEKGIKGYKTLSKICGVSLSTIYASRSRYGMLSIENLWLLSEGLECTINDIVSPDWEK